MNMNTVDSAEHRDRNCLRTGHFHGPLSSRYSEFRTVGIPPATSINVTIDQGTKWKAKGGPGQSSKSRCQDHGLDTQSVSSRHRRKFEL